jgi:hypothetical protein
MRFANCFPFPVWPNWPINTVNGLTGLLALAGTIFSIVMLIDCLKRRPKEFANPFTKNAAYDRIIWALAIVLSFSYYFIGAIVYFFVVKHDKSKKDHEHENNPQ